ncbi:MAG: type II toxin-antitoxin system Phd/YefM family antitoxin [Rhizobiales bacterium]|nr:type II toxin-antitoxin system Phd/YefM family antitoxin [Hyphomicrobiales bacterium]MBN9010942.1 type II toxin-antitoxin system Phd/YefM family antitoxin [Hyphomicrobiales bacterium]
MGNTWQVQEAKSRFSELIERAEKEGPQTITRHGKPSAVVVSMAEYERLEKAGAEEKPNLIDFLLTSGPILDDFEIERDKDVGREINLD